MLYGDDWPNRYDAARLTGQERPNHGVHPIDNVIAELLDRYRIRFPEIDVTVLVEPSATS